MTLDPYPHVTEAESPMDMLPESGFCLSWIRWDPPNGWLDPSLFGFDFSWLLPQVISNPFTISRRVPEQLLPGLKAQLYAQNSGPECFT